MRNRLGRFLTYSLVMVLGIMSVLSSSIVEASETESTQYQTVVDELRELEPDVQAEPVLVANSVGEIRSDVTTEYQGDFASCRLIITSSEDMEIKEESLGVDNIKSVQRFEDKYIVEYSAPYFTEQAYNNYVSQGYDVEIDQIADTPETTDNKLAENQNVDVAKEEVATTNTDKADTSMSNRDIVVAILDTGLNKGEEIFDGKTVDGIDCVAENGNYEDIDGHGTTMARIVLDQVSDVNEDNHIKIMPIKVLNDNGQGTTLSAYKGIKYAIEKKVDVINLSMSGIGHSKLLESAINEAYNNGIPVVVSAGNDNREITEYTPANIESAITISAVCGTSEDVSLATNNDSIVRADYSNYGTDTTPLDFSANGYYEYVRNINDKDVITKVNGTSVSAAYVTSYIASLKAQALSDDDESNNNMKVADIYSVLDSSAIKVKNDNRLNSKYYGNGYLSKENITLDKKEHEEKQEKTVENVSNINENIQLSKTSFVDDSGRLWVDNELDLMIALYDANEMGTDSFMTWYSWITNGWDREHILLTRDMYISETIYLKNAQAKSLTGYWDNGGSRTKGEAVHIINNMNDDKQYTNCSFMVDSVLNLNNVAFDGNAHNIKEEKTYGIKSSDTANLMIGRKGTVVASDCTFYNTYSYGNINGVGQLFNNGGNLTLYNCNVYGGGDFMRPNGATGLILSGTTIINNSDIFSCGLSGIHLIKKSEFNTTTTINNSKIRSNNDNGIFNAGSIVNISYLEIYDNGKNAVYNTDHEGSEAIINSNNTNYRDSRIMNFSTFNSTSDTITNSNGEGISNMQKYEDAGEGKGEVNINSTITNCKDYGIFNANGGKVNVLGGVISNNKTGISNIGKYNENTSSLVIYGGKIYSNNIGLSNSAFMIYGEQFDSNKLNSLMSTDVNIKTIYESEYNKAISQGTDNTYAYLVGASKVRDYWLSVYAPHIYNNNSFGIDNNGYVFQYSGNIYNNKGITPEIVYGIQNGGIDQKGKYYISDCAKINSNNIVFLGRNNCVLNIEDTMNNNDTIILTTNIDDRAVGRTLVTSANETIANASASKFQLAFRQPSANSDGSSFSGETNSAVVRHKSMTSTRRSITGVSDCNMVLSAKYYVNYDKNINDEDLIIDEIQRTGFFWNESVLEFTSSRCIPYRKTEEGYKGTNLDESGEKEFIGWCLDKYGKSTIINSNIEESLANNKTWYAIYSRNAAPICYNPNGAVDSDGKLYSNVYTDPIKFQNGESLNKVKLEDGSIFGQRQSQQGYYIKGDEPSRSIEDHNTYYLTQEGEIVNNLGDNNKLASFQGWSAIDYARMCPNNGTDSIVYDAIDKIIYNPVEAIYVNMFYDTVTVNNHQYNNINNKDSISWEELKYIANTIIHGRIAGNKDYIDDIDYINMYAVWDEYPTIISSNITVPKEDIADIDEDYILNKTKFVVKDREDGSNVNVVLEGYNDALLVGLCEGESVTLYIKVTDSVGNVTCAPIKISIGSNSATSRRTLIRFWDKDYIDLNEEDGGLMEDSKWKLLFIEELLDAC